MNILFFLIHLSVSIMTSFITVKLYSVFYESMELSLYCLLICNFIAVSSSADKNIGNSEQKIFEKIFNQFHDPYVRPIKKREDQLVMVVGVSYHQLVDVNEKDQIITSSIWLRQKWTNQLMTWNKEEFDNMTVVSTFPEKVWKPDLYLYNNADDSSDGNQHSFNTKVMLYNNGRNVWLAPIIIKTACKINVEHFPFDEQFCNVTLGSWTYDTKRLDVQLESDTADLTKFVSNGEWDLISMTGSRNVLTYPCCPDVNYADLTYTIRIRRRTRYYYVNLIIPCFVITALSILAFKVPPDTGERVTLVITNLLSMIVFLLLVADILPPISDATPLISVYYSIVMFEIGFALLCTCVVLKVNFRHASHGEMPKWFRTLVLHWMARVFRMTPQVKLAESQQTHFKKRRQSFIQSIFTSFKTRRASLSRFYNPRGSVSNNDTNKKSKRLVKISTSFENNEAQNNGEKKCSVENERAKTQVALTEITCEGTLPRDHKGLSRTQNDVEGIKDVLAIPKRDKRQISGGKVPEMGEAINITANRSYSQEETRDECLACSDTSPMHVLVQQQEEIVGHVESLANMARDNEEDEIKREEWKVAAAVLDEFFFWLYLIIIAISKAIVFSMVPSYDD
ncbi:neuronal acetylcholine receptor subunit alpha-10-like isoform X2 [Xenia sp. Carnegie-2017]|uniref:neuronal acetylcholine receptor subunit alpha-10-like isoform X2 n=1 Tax=Xenia sp. Carnegie-2017 TaxID=2897299 RepID=UPI001F0444CF|nr:neuronal acetylcholine receptor subunit alpha-10-like isoform X2 [Xenia sp. Carnegie-2017]